jgi:hypothetical protein
MEPEYLTPKQLVAHFRWLTMGGLRKFLLEREYNGLNKHGAVIELTRKKLLIDRALFLSWVESHRGKGK